MNEGGTDVDGGTALPRWLPSTTQPEGVESWFRDPDAGDPDLLDRNAKSGWWGREREVGTPFLLVPVLLALGIGAYFAAPYEPWVWTGPLAGGLAITGAIFAAGREIWFGFAIVALGFTAADLRVQFVDTATLTSARLVDFEGLVERTEVREDGGVRYTAVADGQAGAVWELGFDRIRFTVRQEHTSIPPGSRVEVRLRALPPSGPVRPSGYDFGFQAWFEGRGASGYAVSVPVVRSHAPGGVDGLRYRLAQRIRTQLPGDAGGLAAALLTGDRSGISAATQEDMRRSGLAHILAISGLHMALLTGLVFVSLRKIGAALSPRFVQHVPIRKLAAAGALAAAAGYLAVSGFAISTQRAFVMLSVALVAILLDRRALTMRTVATAAIMVLVTQPESLFAAGFQMSFAAVAALVAIYSAWDARSSNREARGRLRRLVSGAGTLAVTSLVAGIATAPFALYHFGRVASLGLLANLLAMPIVTILVMPLILALAVSIPFGLDPVVLIPLGWSLETMSAIARRVSEVADPIRTVAIPPAALLTLASGFVTLVAFQTSARWIGLGALPIALVLTAFAAIPFAIVQENGRVITFDGTDARLSAGTGRGFADRIVLETFGVTAGNLDKFACDEVGCATRVSGYDIAVPRYPEALATDCARANIVIGLSQECRSGSGAPLRITTEDLERYGAHALYMDGTSVRIERALPANRPWTAHRHTGTR